MKPRLIDKYENISLKITNTKKYKKYKEIQRNTKLSTLVAQNMRGEFVEKCRAVKSASPKLEFYFSLKKEFGLENYLNLVKCPDARRSLTRLRISAHNLYIERGRYETPLVPRAERLCVYCKLNLGIDTIKNECHVLIQFNFYPKDLSELAGLLSNQNLTPVQATAVAQSMHAILTTNLCYTDCYKSGDFHTNCGSCTIL